MNMRRFRRVGCSTAGLLMSTMTIAQSVSDTTNCQGVFNPSDVQRQPEFVGGMPALYEYLGTNLRYPDAAYEAGIQGRVFVQFIVDHEGRVTNATVKRGVDPALDAEALRVVQSMPKWDPALKECGSVDCLYTLPVNFKVQVVDVVSDTEQTIEVPVDSSLYDLKEVETMPEFPGGMEAMYRFLAQNTRYPGDAMEKNVQGKVWIEFTVGTNGTLQNIIVKRGLHPSLDAEALRVMGTMPPWRPGTLDGRPVRCRFAMPISWKMQ